jgi:signal transduction histidine kinase
LRRPAPLRPLLVDARPDSIRRQESGLILLNLAILGGIALSHVLLGPAFGRPPRIFTLALATRCLMQSVELILLQDRLPGAVPARAVLAYAHVSIWLNLGFALLLSHLAELPDSHYPALMVVPVIAAAFRYRPPGIGLVVSAAGSATFLEVWLYRRRYAGAAGTEYMEAAGVALIYVVIGVVVALLVRQLRAERSAAETGLAELQRTKDRLVEEEKLAAVGRLAGAIAHEIRNPVAMIVSSLALARRGGEQALPREELDGILETEAARLERLTTDFLSYANARPLERQETEVGTLLAYVADVAQARSAEKKVRLRVAASEDFVVPLDAFQVHQALLNLVLNALDGAPEGTEVVLGARRDRSEAGPGGVTFTVQNGGPGIPAEHRQRIFEPFFTTKPSGTGLGLAITRRIARAHGGDAVLEANEPGTVRFALTLPGSGGPLRPQEETHAAHSDR